MVLLTGDRKFALAAAAACFKIAPPKLGQAMAAPVPGSVAWGREDEPSAADVDDGRERSRELFDCV